jgi:Bacterial TSP3 repeat
MHRFHIPRLFLVVALAALAMLALPGVAAAKHKHRGRSNATVRHRDRNHDGIPDRWEKRHHLSLKVNQAHRDQDRDHLRNRAEFLAGDNPRNPDTDGDGIPDGEENAGTIASFDTESGKLTIDLFGGETISGMVTEETEIKCESSSPTASASMSSQSEDSSGDEQGQEEEGQEEQEEEQGDDEGESGGDQGGSANCTTADLTPGAVVKQAELQVESGTPVFEEVELAG